VNDDDAVSRRMLRTRPSRVTFAAIALGVVLLTAACSGPATTAQANSPAAQPAPAAGSSSSPGGSPQLQFAECMRSNGVTDFPDPDSNGQFALPDNTGDLNPTSPVNQKAQEACQHFLGSDEHGTPAQEAQDGAKLLSYAKCMRSHGITNFPDPFRHPDGGYGFLYTNQVDQSSPAFLAANQACRNLLPGDHHEGR
jgi:hypothetical protein